MLPRYDISGWRRSARLTASATGDRAPSARSIRPAAPLGGCPGDMAVLVPRGEIHPGVRVRRVFAENVLDTAHRLDEGPPVGRTEETEAADAVADGDLIGGLMLVLQLHQLLD